MYTCTPNGWEVIPIGKRNEVAKLAGVSEATVSRVFNNVGPLREETKHRVLEAAAALNYHPNAIAKSFATGKSGNIGVIVPYLPKVRLLSTHYFSEILSGIGLKLAEHQYNLLLMFQQAESTHDYIQLFETQRIDGCIILGSRDIPGEAESIQKLHEQMLPYCLVNQTFPGRPFNSVDAKHYEGSYEAVSMLLKMGHRRIAFINGPEEYSNSAERLSGFQHALHAHGIEFSPTSVFSGNYSRSSGIEAAKEIAGHMGELDAIFAANDRMAIGVQQGLAEAGYHAGSDYALVGYDNSDASTMVQPNLTTVHVPLFEMGILAVDKIMKALLSKETAPFQERLPVKLVKRDSTNYMKERWK